MPTPQSTILFSFSLPLKEYFPLVFICPFDTYKYPFPPSSFATTQHNSIHFLILSLISKQTAFASIYPPPKKTKALATTKERRNTMSGVWVFKNGVIRLVENPQAETSSRKKALVHLPSGQVVSSYSTLEQILTGLGWERYYGGDPDLFQFHKRSSIDLISLPRDFSKFNSVYMYDIVIKNPNIFHVRDM
ncbi:flowering-promoting factor 1 [Prunus persica]|nr:flowering-promoting factor 1 [Prunus persica]